MGYDDKSRTDVSVSFVCLSACQFISLSVYRYIPYRYIPYCDKLNKMACFAGWCVDKLIKDMGCTDILIKDMLIKYIRCTAVLLKDMTNSITCNVERSTEIFIC